MLIIKFTFNITHPDTGSFVTVTMTGRGKTIADCRKDARKQAYRYRNAMKVFEMSPAKEEK